MNSNLPSSVTPHIYHDGFPITDEDKIPLYQRIARTRLGLAMLVLFGILFGGVSFVYLSWPMLSLFFSGILSHHYFRWYLDVTIGCWIYMKAYILENVFGIRVRIFGHNEKFSDRSLIILNHRCHFDWLFFWIVAGKIGDSSKWQVMLKKIGKIAPFFGWTMQARNHFFLSRKWDQDESELRWKLSYLKAMNTKYQILLFPEGTDFNEKSRSKSHKYSETNNLPKYEYVLQPKSTGFIYTLKTLRKYKIDAVYDVTVGYPDVLAKTEVDMFKNSKIPHEIHYHIKKHDISSIPETDKGIDQWLRQQWEEKEERLKTFYTHREFRETTSMSSKQSNDVKNGPSNHSSAEVFADMSFGRFFLSQLFYTAQGSFFLFLCYWNWYCIVWGVLAAAWLQYISVKAAGLDFIIMKNCKDPAFIQEREKNFHFE